MALGGNEGHVHVVQGSPGNNQYFFALIVGIVIGFSLTQIILISPYTQPMQHINMLDPEPTNAESSEEESTATEFNKGELHEHTHFDENSTVADKLHKEVRVLCWIMTGPKNHQKKAIHVKRTWGKHCNKLLFMSSVEDKELGSIALNVSEGRHWLWGKTKEAFKYIYKHHMDDADWFYKADDDTFAIMENMRYLLYPYSPETPIHFGLKFNLVKPSGYFSGGAGYVLSKEAVRRFVTEGLPNKTLCSERDYGVEDLLIGACLQKLNVIAGDSRDSDTRGRFFAFYPAFILLKFPSSWYYKYLYYKSDGGLDCCSDYTIAFHYISPDSMYNLNYLVYHLRQYGVINLPEELPKKLAVGMTMPVPVKPRAVIK